MRTNIGRSAPIALAAAWLLVACSTGGGASKAAGTPTIGGMGGAVRPFEAIESRVVPFPPGVTAMRTPVWTADGTGLVFTFAGIGHGSDQLGVVGIDGTGFLCITCGRDGGATTWSEPFAFADGRRALVRADGNEDTDADPWSYVVVECTPSLVRCDEVAMLPVDVTSVAGAATTLQAREMRVAPDDRHVAYTLIRTDGVVMVVAGFERLDDRYVVVDATAVNPPTDLGRDAQSWVDAGTFYEINQFADGGRKLLYVGFQDAANPDVFELDLATGASRRITLDTEWEEDVDLNPDGRSYLVWSTRPMNRTSTFSQLTRPALLDAIVLPHHARVAFTPQTRPCALEPWLVIDGEEAGYRGQPVAPSPESGWDARNMGRWSPDGTAAVFWETRLPSADDSRVRIVELPARSPVEPSADVGVPAMGWATPLATFTAMPDGDVHEVLDGPHGGTAVIDVTGNLVSGTRRVEFDDFGWEEGSVLDGTEEIDNELLSDSAHYRADLRLSGRRNGWMTADVRYGETSMSGTTASEVDGNALRPTDGFDCTLPQRSELILEAATTADRVEVVVAADVYGDVRPVRGATVTVGAATARTDERGRAALARSGRAGQVTVTAGTAFTATSVALR